MTGGSEVQRRSPTSSATELPIGSLVNVLALAQLGLGKLHKYDELGRAVVHFTDEGTRTLARETPLVRARLSEGTPVRFKTDGGETEIGEISGWLAEREDGGFVYAVRGEDEVHEVWEGVLMPLTGDDPAQLLRSYRWDTPASFVARWSIADLEARWHAASGGFAPMLGARVTPLGHQIYAARRVLFDRTPRFILADEVGLGKTIEAGLIVQALQADRPDFSVLVVAPGSMSRQWLTETYLRFGARAYCHIDRQRIAGETRKAIGGLTCQPRVIVSTTALEAHPEVAEQLCGRRWDMVIVDEAHQIPQGSRLYPVLERLAAASEGLLLLSATPSKRDLDGLVGLLALVAPEAYRDAPSEILQLRYQQQRGIWDRLNFTRKMIDSAAKEGRELDGDELVFVAEEWGDLIPGDQLVSEFLQRMRAGESAAAVELVAYVQEFHRLDHRIIRTRRATLRDGARAWPVRELEEVAWSPVGAEAIFLRHLDELPGWEDEVHACLRVLYHRACSTSPDSAVTFLRARREALDRGPAGAITHPLGRLASDPGPDEEPLVIGEIIEDLPEAPGEAAWLRTAIALADAWLEEGDWSRAAALGDWLESHLADPEHQVLVFAHDAGAAEELAAKLETRFGARAVARFHCRIAEADLAATAFRFQHDKSCRILVSDELGGEGRNFQNASAVAHFDLPLSCARLEQRIGRLDRVSRPAEQAVLSVVMEPATALEGALLETHRDVFQVFVRTVGGLEFVLPELQRRALAAYGAGEAALRDLAQDLRREVEEALNASDEAFDDSLDATKPQLERSVALAREMREGPEAGETATAVRFWASRLGVQSKVTDDGTTEFRWTNGSLNVTNDRLRLGSGEDGESRLIRGTFDAEAGLAREDLQFFAPGHDLIDTMVWEAEHARHSRVTAYAIEGFPKNRGTLLLQVLARSSVDDRLWRGHEITPGLAAKARALLSSEVLAEVMLVWNGRAAHHAIVTHPGLRSQLDQPVRGLKRVPIEPATLSRASYLGDLWSAIDRATPEALASIAERRATAAAERAEHLEKEMRAELAYLRWQAQTAASEEEAGVHRTAIEARAALVQSVKSPRTELLGLALVALV